MSLTVLFHFLCAQHVSDINISIIRSLRLCCWITTSVVLFSVRCVLELWCGWVSVVPVLQAEASGCKTSTTQNQPHQISNTQQTENKTTDVVIQQHSHKLLMMDILMYETRWAHKKWNKIASDIKLVFHSSTITSNAYVYHAGNIEVHAVSDQDWKICPVMLAVFVYYFRQNLRFWHFPLC